MSSDTSLSYGYTTTGNVLQVISAKSAHKDASATIASLNSNQVALKMLASPINPADLNAIEGVYGTPLVKKDEEHVSEKVDEDEWVVAGQEGVAEVLASESPDFDVGDWVIPKSLNFGTWRNSTFTKNSNQVIKITKFDGLTVEDASTLAVNPCTAYRMLESNAFGVELNAGDVIVQNGANSSVGQAVIQIAKTRGIITVNILRQDEHWDRWSEHLKGLGADLVVPSDYAKSFEFKRLLSDLPEPKLGLNCIGGIDATSVAKSLGHNATMVTYGGMSKKPLTIPTSLMIFKNLTLKGFWMSQWVQDNTDEKRREMMNDILTMTKEGHFKTWIETFKFQDFDKALLAVKNRITNRKVVLKMEE